MSDGVASGQDHPVITGHDHRHYRFDRQMTRLLEYCSVPPQHRNVDEILTIVDDEAPNLLSGLALSNNRAIARNLQIKIYKKNDVVFLQNAYPDAYYTVLRGAVSIYAFSSSAVVTEEEKMNDNRLQYGKFLVQLSSGVGFGELSFNGDGKHTLRNAGVVADGLLSHQMDSHDQENTPKPNQRDLGGDKEKESNLPKDINGNELDENGRYSNMTVLLLIPEKSYMSEMYSLHASKNNTKEKITFLRRSFLFASWSMDHLVKMAYAMKKKDFVRGEQLCRQGDRAELIFLIKKGKCKVSIMSVVKLENDVGKLVGTTNRAVDIAELGENDIFGLVESYGGSKKMKRTAAAASPLEVYVMNSASFYQFLSQVPRTMTLVEKVVQKRKNWEKLRVEYAKNFPTMKCTLPANSSEMSKYSLSRQSTMSESELKELKEQNLVLYRHLREARSCYRGAIMKAKAKKFSGAESGMQKVKEYCTDAMKIADEIFDVEMKQQAEDIFVEANEQEQVMRDNQIQEKNKKKSPGKTSPNKNKPASSSPAVSAELSEQAKKAAEIPDGVRLQRRGSAALVALRIRELGSKDDIGDGDGNGDTKGGVGGDIERKGTNSGKSSSKSPTKGGKKGRTGNRGSGGGGDSNSDEEVNPLSPGSGEAHKLSRMNRRQSIHALAEAAGLGTHEQFKSLAVSSPTSPTRSPSGVGPRSAKIPLSKRSSFLRKFKADSFFNLITKPTKPEKEKSGKPGFGKRARSLAQSTAEQGVFDSTARDAVIADDDALVKSGEKSKVHRMRSTAF